MRSNNLVNTEPCEYREPIMRDKLDTLCDILNECYSLANAIDARLYSPRPIPPGTKGDSCIESVEDKIRTLHSRASDICDLLRDINDRL